LELWNIRRCVHMAVIMEPSMWHISAIPWKTAYGPQVNKLLKYVTWNKVMAKINNYKNYIAASTIFTIQFMNKIAYMNNKMHDRQRQWRRSIFWIILYNYTTYTTWQLCNKCLHIQFKSIVMYKTSNFPSIFEKQNNVRQIVMMKTE
jgi:hypothetical protein